MAKRTKSYWFYQNTFASIWIPIRLIISVAIISFFTCLVVIGSQIATETVSFNEFTNDINEIKQSLESLYRHGDCRDLFDAESPPGSKRVFELKVPLSISSVHFGKKQSEITELSSSIRYRSTKRLITIWVHPDIQLVSGVRKKDTWQPNENKVGLSITQGRYYLTAELVSTNSQQFILLYTNNK